MAGRACIDEGLGIRGIEHAGLALDIADRSREATVHTDLNVSRGGLGDTGQDARLDKLAVQVDIQVALEHCDGHREPRLQRNVLHGAREDITRGRSSRIGRGGLTAGGRIVARMDGHTHVQGVLIGRQRDLRSLYACVGGVSTAQDDLLLAKAVVPILDVAPKLQTLINHSCRDLRARHRVGLLAIQRTIGQILGHGTGDLRDGLSRPDLLDHGKQKHRDQSLQGVAAPRTRGCRSRWSKRRERFHLYDRGKNEPTHLRRMRGRCTAIIVV